MQRPNLVRAQHTLPVRGNPGSEDLASCRGKLQNRLEEMGQQGDMRTWRQKNREKQYERQRERGRERETHTEIEHQRYTKMQRDRGRREIERDRRTDRQKQRKEKQAATERSGRNRETETGRQGKIKS